MSPSPRPSLSITLPPSFQFHYTDGQLPKTPDQQLEEEATIDPPPPPKQTYKIKRKARTSAPFEEPAASSHQIIPTIEMSEASDAPFGASSPPTVATPSSHTLLAPMSSSHRAVTPPRTPAPRLYTAFDHAESPAQEWSLITATHEKRPIYERAGSICSTFSDSSISSAGSSAFSAPFGGNISPDSEATDPFMDDEFPKDPVITSPDENKGSPCAKRVKTQADTKWTPAMDEHLWMTYTTYVSDPTLTPFKMLPGTTPPLGVCHRVAAKAKRTWKEYRASSLSPMDAMFASSSRRQGSPDTIRPDGAPAREMKRHQWPRTESTTRRRLRYLCKRKPSFSAHYQRLLRTRSPSPFQSSSTEMNRSSEPPSTFGGSDLKISLITSTNPSMQPNGPLAQLASDPDRPRPQSQRESRPVDWFARIGRSQAHQKSMSLQSGLGLQARTSLQRSGVLASPFDERSHLLSSTAKSLGRNNFNVAATSLDSPFEVTGAPTAPRSLKRRFHPDEEKPKRTAIQDIFSPPDSNSIIRNRGFTVGAASASDNLAKLFTPPSTVTPASGPFMPSSAGQDHEMTDQPELPELSTMGPPGSRSVPRRLAEPTPRLGSPFVEAAALRQYNTFPRSYIPSESNPQPFQQKLKELAAQQAGN